MGLGAVAGCSWASIGRGEPQDCAGRQAMGSVLAGPPYSLRKKNGKAVKRKEALA